MKRRCLTLLPAIAILLFPLTAYANSTWAWLTETTPLTILPFAITGTLAIEIFAVIKFGKVRKRLKAALIITLANAFSFIGGYFIGTINLDGHTVMEVIMQYPHYIISVLYLLITLLGEFPAVCLSLWEDTDNKNRLVLSVIVSNTLTTLLVVACESIFAPGMTGG